MFRRLILIVLIGVCLSVNAVADEDNGMETSGVAVVEETALIEKENQTAADDSKEDIGKITIEDESETVELLHSSMPVSIIEMEKYHGRNISLNEILKRVAGVKVKQEGGFGSRATIAIQGLEGKRVKIYIDGNPLNAPDGTFGINDMPIQLIERIEVYKGVVPARFGGDAIGGAVNVVTREFEGSWIDLNASIGSYDTYRGMAVLKKNFEEQNIEVGVGGFYNDAANDYIMDSPYVDGLRIKRDHDHFNSWLAAYAMTINERWFDEISLELVRYESEQEIQGIKTPVQQAKNASDLNVVVLGFEREDFFLKGLSFDYDFLYADLTLHFMDKASTCRNWDGTTRPCSGVGGEVGAIPHDSADKQEDLRHDLNLFYPVTGNYGVNFHLNTQISEYTPDDDLASEILGYDVGGFPSERISTVLSLSLESSHFGDAVANDMGIKSYHYDFKITPAARGLTGTPVQSKNDGSEFGWYESIRYEPVADLFIKASYEHAFRLPNTSEIFGDGITITAGADLEPEESDNFNLGILFDRYDFYNIPWLKAEATFFYRDLKNMIRLEHSTHTSGYVNLGRTEVRGFEVEVQADLTDRWYMYANYTNQSLVDKQKKMAGTISTPNPTYNEDVPNVPKQYANIGVEYTTLGLLRSDALFKVFWEANWADEYYYGWELSKYQDRKIDAQVSHTLGFEYSFDEDKYILGFEVRNLTDEEITDVFNYPLMGRTYHLNLRYTWFSQ